MSGEIFTKEEKKVEYSELIYDLIFVYIIGRNNSLLHDITNGFVRPQLFFAYILCTLAVIQIWNFSTYYINLYGKNKLREHIFLFTNMYLLYFMADGTRVHWQGFEMRYNLAWAAILANIGIQYTAEFLSQKDRPSDRKLSLRMAAVLFTEALIIVLNIPVYKKTGVLLSPFAILFGIGATFMSRRGSGTGIVDFAHLSERAMLYIVFTFGEMIIAAASYFDGEINFGRVYFSLMAFLIVVGLFLSYGTFYDHILDREKKCSGLSYMVIHIFMIFALNNITTALEFMQDEEVALIPKMVFLLLSFIIYYVSLFAASGYAKIKCRPSISFDVKMLLLSAGFIVLMILFRNFMYVNIALTVVYVFTVYPVLHRIGRFNSAAN